MSGRRKPTRLRAVPERARDGAAESSAPPAAPLDVDAAAATTRAGLPAERYRREIFERLVASARSAIYSRSLDELTVNDITDAADVGKRTFFDYFQSKEHVVPHVDEFPARILEAVERARTGAEPVGAVIVDLVRTALWPKNMDRNWLTFFENFLRAMVTSPDVRALIAEQLDTTRQAYSMLIAVGQERGEFRRDRGRDVLAAHLQSVLMGHAMLEWLNGRTLDTPMTDAVLHHTLRTLEPVPPARRRLASTRRARSVRSPAKAPVGKGSAAKLDRD